MNQNKIEEIANLIKQKACFLIGICGIPGAGKSTLSLKLHQILDKSIIIPMDGYHLYRKDLNQEGIKFRGAPFTFDLKMFGEKIKQVKKKQHFPISFPSFDHALKDPVEQSIHLQEDIKHVLVQGLYIFDKQLDLDHCWDLKIWIEADLQNSMERLTKRNFEAGISPTLQQAWTRTNFNDRKNALHVLSHSITTNSIIIHN